MSAAALLVSALIAHVTPRRAFLARDDPEWGVEREPDWSPGQSGRAAPAGGCEGIGLPPLFAAPPVFPISEFNRQSGITLRGPARHVQLRRTPRIHIPVVHWVP